MMNIFKIYKKKIAKIIQDLAILEKIEILPGKYQVFTLEPCKEKKHGDLATNSAMIFTKDFGCKPRDLAEKIILELEKDQQIAKIEIAGPGFINITFKNDIWYNFLSNILSKKEVTLPNLGGSEKINLEYASPNPTGPMHIGHTRGAIYGDVLANLLLKTGHDVVKEYYVNDAGEQIITLVKSAYLRYLEALGREIVITEGLYPGDYLIEIGQKLKENYGLELLQKSEEEYIILIRDFVVKAMMEMIKNDLARLGIKHDVFTFEKKELHESGRIEEAINILKDQGLIYKGVLEAPKGKVDENYEGQEQELFKSTNFGDDSDRVVKKADGSYTYLAGDIGYALDKFERGFTKMILPLGFDHSGYVKRLSGVVKAISNNEAKVKVILCQMVRFVKNGEPLKMSKRSGNFITAKELVDEVGQDIIRFIMLTRKNDAPFDFDLAKVINQSKDNPIFYVQYAYARCCSVLRNLNDEMPNLIDLDNYKIEDSTFLNLNHEIELDLIKKLANYERVIEMSVNNYEPHRIAFYLTELSAIFHSYYHEGKKDDSLRFIVHDKNTTKSRILLIMALMRIIQNALSIFSIKPMQEM